MFEILHFTEDLNNQVVRYVLTSDPKVTQDSFTFDLMDKKPNKVSDNVFHILWAVIGFEQTTVNVTETSGVIRIPVIRKGNLKQVGQRNITSNLSVCSFVTELL